MLERFTKDARAVVVATQDVCRGLEAPEVAPVHVLLALTADGASLSGLLTAHGVTTASVTHALRAEGVTSRPERRPLGEEDAEALRALGIDLDAIRAAVERQFGEGALDRGVSADEDAADEEAPVGWPGRGRLRFGGGHIRFSGGAKKVLELALREALRVGSSDIRTEHIALGLLRADDDLVRKVLWQLSVDTRTLRAEVEDRLRRSA